MSEINASGHLLYEGDHVDTFTTPDLEALESNASTVAHQERPSAKVERIAVEHELRLLSMHVPQAARTIRAMLAYIDALHAQQHAEEV